MSEGIGSLQMVCMVLVFLHSQNLSMDSETQKIDDILIDRVEKQEVSTEMEFSIA